MKNDIKLEKLVNKQFSFEIELKETYVKHFCKFWNEITGFWHKDMEISQNKETKLYTIKCIFKAEKEIKSVEFWAGFQFASWGIQIENINFNYL